jgi:hypothetical protein
MISPNMIGKEMSNFDYLAESALTASDSFHSDKVDPVVLERVLTDCIDSLQALDALKKALFYGKDVGKLPAKYVDDIENSLGVEYPDTDIVHGIIGAATEAGELLEALYAKLYDHKELDLVNVFEEVGDSTWYLALLRKAGRTFDDVFRNNIDKLRKRFGGKFTEYDAKNRNLVDERAILETGLNTARDILKDGLANDKA